MDSAQPPSSSQRSWYCHQCRGEIVPENSPPQCPLCHGEFIEQMEESHDDPRSWHSLLGQHPPPNPLATQAPNPTGRSGPSPFLFLAPRILRGFEQGSSPPGLNNQNQSNNVNNDSNNSSNENRDRENHPFSPLVQMLMGALNNNSQQQPSQSTQNNPSSPSSAQPNSQPNSQQPSTGRPTTHTIHSDGISLTFHFADGLRNPGQEPDGQSDQSDPSPPQSQQYQNQENTTGPRNTMTTLLNYLQNAFNTRQNANDQEAGENEPSSDNSEMPDSTSPNADGTNRTPREPESALMESVMRMLRAIGPGEVQFVMGPALGRDGQPMQGFGFPGVMGNYVFSQQGEDSIMNMLLAQAVAERSGPAPATKEMIDSLPRITLTQDMMSQNSISDCAICKDDLEVDIEIIKLPCNHIYHPQCIITWLETSRTCPICRFTLVDPSSPDSQSQGGENNEQSQNSETAQSQGPTVSTSPGIMLEGSVLQMPGEFPFFRSHIFAPQGQGQRDQQQQQHSSESPSASSSQRHPQQATSSGNSGTRPSDRRASSDRTRKRQRTGAHNDNDDDEVIESSADDTDDDDDENIEYLPQIDPVD